ncbi:unnamed protein product [Onchocerca flexuosa]|uniref:TolC family protein n=1 Tax=Onchocerca flexuosa TaxID=387005 RepID=A0A183H3V1_9BILA|nr:unnamed protein product [Onchocerca flexuosa]
MFSTVNRDLHASVEAKIAAYETSEAWIEAAKEENLNIKTHFEVQSEANYSDAIVSIVQKERQFANVHAPSLENIEIYSVFGFYPEEELLSVTVISNKIIEITEKQNKDEMTKLDIETCHYTLNHELVEANLMMETNYKALAEQSLCLFAKELVEGIINTTYEHIIQESEENISTMIELYQKSTIQSSQIDLRNVFQLRRIIKENEMEALWNRTQLSVEIYQHLDLTSPAQISECISILPENIYEEGLLFIFVTQ